MRYYFLRLLSLLKRALGYLMTKTAAAYNKLGAFIASGIVKEEAKIEDLKQRNINKAKQDVVVAAQRVIELEQNVGAVAAKETEKADNKLFKLKTKVQ